MNPSPQPGSGKAPLITVVLFYGALVAIAWVWDAYRGGQSGMVLHGSGTVLRDGAIGVGSGLLVVLLSRLMHERSSRARALSYEMRRTLGPLTGFEILVYAVTSSVGEEIFFRGAMQAAIGFVATSIVFGFVHGFFVGKWILWSVFALVMGFFLGALVLATGNLLAAIAAHFTTNFINLHVLNRLDPEEART